MSDMPYTPKITIDELDKLQQAAVDKIIDGMSDLMKDAMRPMHKADPQYFGAIVVADPETGEDQPVGIDAWQYVYSMALIGLFNTIDMNTNGDAQGFMDWAFKTYHEEYHQRLNRGNLYA